MLSYSCSARRSFVRRVCSSLPGLLFCLSCEKISSKSVILFAPASTADVFQAALISHCSPGACLGSYASSAALARQIAYSTPADIYVSAHPRWMDYLTKKGLVQEQSRIRLFSNHLVLVRRLSSSTKPLSKAQARKEKKEFVSTFHWKEFIKRSLCWAIGDPEYVPVGIYTRQALENMHLWSELRPKLLLAANARLARHYVERGECPFGIIYQSDTHNNVRLQSLYKFPAQTHEAIRYEIALTRMARPAAMGLFKYLASPQRKGLYQKFGFQP